MKNISFVLWMLGWPMVLGFSNNSGTHQQYSDLTIATVGLISIAIWIFVGYKLYEKTN